MPCTENTKFVARSTTFGQPGSKRRQHVAKDEELGFFQFGGSTHCLVFHPGVITDFTGTRVRHQGVAIESSEPGRAHWEIVCEPEIRVGWALRIDEVPLAHDQTDAADDITDSLAMR